MLYKVCGEMRFRYEKKLVRGIIIECFSRFSQNEAEKG